MSKRSEEQRRALQDPAAWEEAGEVHPPVKNARAVVSVAFSRDDFGRVAEAARAGGMKISTFIRQAAVERAEQRDAGRDRARVVVTSATRSGYIEGTFTTSSSVRVEKEESEEYDSASRIIAVSG